MYIADSPGAVGGLASSEPPRQAIKLKAEIDVQLRWVKEAKKPDRTLSDTEIQEFIKNVDYIRGGPEYLEAVKVKFRGPSGIDKVKWKRSCDSGEMPFPPRLIDDHPDSERGKELFWYDTSRKKMLRFKCDRLEFIYDSDAKRQVPIPVKANKSERVENNREEILTWVEVNAAGLGLEVLDADERSVIVAFPDWQNGVDCRKLVEESLYAARFRYGIERA
jgi:hypothetical protein